MSKLFNVFAAILLIVGSCFVVSDSHAKVCFLGEECGSGGNFGSHDNINPENMCDDEGYMLKTECEALGMHITEYCPYSSKYGVCCSKDYSYSTCVHPLKSAGVCGKKHKCVCDDKAYPYYQTTKGGVPTCTNRTKPTEYYENGYASGGSCAYTEYVSGEYINKIQFSKCSCDRGLYPKIADECDSIGAETTGDSCTDSDGNTYYSACLCHKDFKVAVANCEFGMKAGDPKCVEGDVTRVKECCTCPAGSYPYDNTMGDIQDKYPEVLEYSSCRTSNGCTLGDSRVKATKCAKGWMVEDGKCVPIPCEDAIKLFIAEDSSYALFTSGGTKGGRLVDANGNTITSGSKIAIVGDGMKDDNTKATDGSGTITISGVASNTSKNVPVTNWIENRICTAVICQVGVSSYDDTKSKCEDSGCSCSSNQNCYFSYGYSTSYVQPGQSHQCCDSYSTGYSSNCYYNSNGGSHPYGTIVCTNSYPTYEREDTTELRYTYRGLGTAFATSYYSGAYLANYLTRTGEGFKAMKRSCTKNPTIEYNPVEEKNGEEVSVPYFPVKSDPSGRTDVPTMYFYGVNLAFPKATTAIRSISMENAQLIVSGTLTTDKKVTLYQNTTSTLKPENAYVNISGTWDVKGELSSNRYEFNPRDVVKSKQGKIKFFTSTYTSADKTVGSITLGNSQQFAVKDLYLTRTNGTTACPPGSCTTTKFATLTITGPSSGSQADVYTDAHLGYDGSSYSRNMRINLSKHVVWNMYDSSGGSYIVELTPGSLLHATDKTSGGSVSQIKKSSSTSLEKCYMTTTWTVIGRDTNDCKSWRSGQDTGHSSQNLVCSIDKSGTTKVTAGGAYAVWLDGGDNGVGWYDTKDQNKIGMYVFNAVFECRVGNNNWSNKTSKSWAKWDGCRLYQMKDGTSGEKKYTSSSPYIICE